MLHTLPDFLSSYWMYFAGGAVLCAVLCYFSEKFLAYFKKGLLIFGVIFALVAGYELVTDSSVFSLPGSVDKKLSGPPQNVETGRRYYKSYEERYGEKPPENN